MKQSRNGFQCGLPPSGSMRLLALLPVTMLVSCQTYDFERVVPLFVAQTTDKTIVASKRLKPNVMLLVDNSGSMLMPTDPSDPDCRVVNTQGATVLCGSASTLCPLGCATRISELKSAMGTFLQTSGSIARLGLTVFPSRGTDANGLNGCDPSSNVPVQLPAPTTADEGTEAALLATAQQVNAEIQRLSPLGGTPTASSLGFVGTYAGLNESSDANDDYRADFVLLLTDGLPNCNGQNANAVCSNPSAACECTTDNCSAGTDPVRSTCSKGCLDRDVTVQKVKELREKGIRTIVVGFGAELASGNGPAVLNAMAREGGVPRCVEGACTTAFYEAANGVELSEALRKIWETLIIVDPCDFRLSARPSDPRYLSVLVDEQNLVPGPDTYSYDSEANKVTFLGAVCEKIKTSTPQHTVSVEFRIVQRF